MHLWVAEPPLPPHTQAGQQDPDIFFTDRPRQGAGLGQRNKEYISFWADEEPVLYGRSPIQVRSRMCRRRWTGCLLIMRRRHGISVVLGWHHAPHRSPQALSHVARNRRRLHVQPADPRMLTPPSRSSHAALPAHLPHTHDCSAMKSSWRPLQTPFPATWGGSSRRS